MKAIVDPEKCIGCRMCAECCPEVFEMEGNLAVVKQNPVRADCEACCREAAAGCPVEAIIVV